MLHFESHSHFPPALIPFSTPSNHYFVLQFYNVVISRMLYKWSQMVPNYFGFFLAQFFGVLSRLLHVSIVHSFFNVELYSSSSSQFNCSPLEGHLDCFHCPTIMDKLLLIFMYRIMCKHKFSFLWNKYPGESESINCSVVSNSLQSHGM